jgi:hypothetical protein
MRSWTFCSTTSTGFGDYLYEIDPQFDEERELLMELNRSVESKSVSFAGMDHNQLVRRKEADGKRTLDTSFVSTPP